MVPESPRWTLCMRGDAEAATKALEKLRGTSDVGAEVDALREESAAQKGTEEKGLSFADMFRGSLRWPMTIATMLMLAQQLSGINAAMFYSTVIFKQAGLSDTGAVYATIGMGAVNVLTTIVSVWLVDHPKAGRRTLLLVGVIGIRVNFNVYERDTMGKLWCYPIREFVRHLIRYWSRLNPMVLRI
ncbi:hypothetical protein ANCDUO_16387 [Ancylostoma duodenale]|uniref:Major facilitator superfamily (MFS) profile domain-containing protein n=1 Tax=Ancylostoma duodenale TaxID=51022 RepID=A0A0C2FY33_9BILA|nr:hypothetical protein ANCDUO_16387 [Ancylostoma duodenale]